MHFECSELDLVEAQELGAVWQHVFEVSTGPVGSPGREVVAHGANTALRQVAQSL